MRALSQELQTEYTVMSTGLVLRENEQAYMSEDKMG
jgi:hypothetical protein